MGQSVTIFGVSLEQKTKTEILNQFAAYLDGNEQNMVVTPNPEMLLLARTNARFKEILNRAAMRLVDGFGIVVLAWLLYGIQLQRYTGVDAVQDIIAMAAQKKKKVFLLGADEAVLEKVIAKYSRLFPALEIMSAAGPRIAIDHTDDNGFTADAEAHERAARLVQEFSPDVLLAGFGHGKQEAWLSAALHKFPSVRLAMGVGGTFDYLSGVTPRAPLWMREIGLEWLYRLWRDPRRIRRIYNAVILFPIYSLNDKWYGRQ